MFKSWITLENIFAEYKVEDCIVRTIGMMNNAWYLRQSNSDGVDYV